MEIKTNSEYNPVQLNETINFSPEGKVLSKSLMINLRNESPKKVWKEYQELKKLINSKEDRPEKKQGKKEQKKDENACPQCGGLLIEKQGISSKTKQPYHFISCSNFPHCRYSEPFVPEAEKNMSCDEDVIAVEDIPF